MKAEILMEDYQRDILKWLGGQEPGLAEVYGGAVRMMTDKTFPGRGRFICHAVREIRNRLADAVAGRGEVRRLDYTSEVEAISDAWNRAGLGGVYQKQGGKTDEAPGQRVPSEVLVLVDTLVSRHRDIKHRKEDNATRLLTALEPENEQLRGSLAPVVKLWNDETEWFVKRAHVGKPVAEDELVTHFKTFETVLRSFRRYFYEGLEEVAQLLGKANASGARPDNEEVASVVSRLGRAKYRMYFFDRLSNPGWIKPLREAGFFRPAGTWEDEGGSVWYSHWVGGKYLKRMAAVEPDEIAEILAEIESENPFVRDTCIKCLGEMPEEVAAKNVKIVNRMLKRSGGNNWFWGGEDAAKLMVRLAEHYSNEAFAIAYTLLDIWRPQKAGVVAQARGRFVAFHYNELVNKYFRKLWAIDAGRGTEVMAKTLNRYLDDVGNENKYIVESGLYRKIERIGELGTSRERDLVAILVGGICEAGKVVIEKQPEKMDELFDYLEGLGKTVFERIEMYLLRFVPAGQQVDRINAIISNRKFLELPYWKHEYRLLLRDKCGEVDEKAIEVFRAWVEEQGVSDEEKESISEWFEKNENRKATEEDFEKIADGRKARALYWLRGVGEYGKLYEKYRVKSGRSDEELAPVARIQVGRAIGATEGSPISVEDMLKMEPSEAVAYVRTPSKWLMDRKNESVFHTPEEGLAGTFEEVVKQRIGDYADLGAAELSDIKPAFLRGYFHGAWEALREKKVEAGTLRKIIAKGGELVGKLKGNNDYEGVFRSVIYIIEAVFQDEDLRNVCLEEQGEVIWGILERLTRYEERDGSTAADEDPQQECINCVPGEAFTLVVKFALRCKNASAHSYEETWGPKLRGVLEYVLENVSAARVRCVFGTWFPQLHWLEEAWVSENLDKIFDYNDKDMWDAVWGSYLSWARAYKKAFGFLVGRDKYGQAIDRIGTTKKYRFGKEQEEGLVEHLMIAYFNGWVEFDDAVLGRFFKSAPAKLRGRAASFLTTGFKAVKEDKEAKETERAKRRERVKQYWEKRLKAIAKNQQANLEETVAFADWAKDSLLGPEDTFGLLARTLDLSGGRVGERHDEVSFVRGVCELATGHELKALRCLNKALASGQVWTSFTLYEEELRELLQSVAELADEYEQVVDVRKEGIRLADAFGRMEYDFKDLYEQLKKRTEQ
jgi:hypothetical protein